MNIAFGCDHAAFSVREKIIDSLKEAGHRVVDFGAVPDQSCDYPEYARAVAGAVAGGECHRGILICGTGVGMSIAANKHHGIRAAVCWNDDIARLCVEHNNANILCLPARFATGEELIRWIDIWIKTVFQGETRHQRRIDGIAAIEKEQCERHNAK